MYKEKCYYNSTTQIPTVDIVSCVVLLIFNIEKSNSLYSEKVIKQCLLNVVYDKK